MNPEITHWEVWTNKGFGQRLVIREDIDNHDILTQGLTLIVKYDVHESSLHKAHALGLELFNVVRDNPALWENYLHE